MLQVSTTASTAKMLECGVSPESTQGSAAQVRLFVHMYHMTVLLQLCTEGEKMKMSQFFPFRLTCADVCIHGDLRLVGGADSLEGRLEICYYNQWGTICDDLWTTNEARVACKQLGYSDTSKYVVYYT